MGLPHRLFQDKAPAQVKGPWPQGACPECGRVSSITPEEERQIENGEKVFCRQSFNTKTPHTLILLEDKIKKI